MVEKRKMVPKMKNTADDSHKSIHTIPYKMHLAMMQSNEKFIRINLFAFVLVMYIVHEKYIERKRKEKPEL